jgi:hypothetical protein
MSHDLKVESNEYLQCMLTEGLEDADHEGDLVQERENSAPMILFQDVKL